MGCIPDREYTEICGAVMTTEYRSIHANWVVVVPCIEQQVERWSLGACESFRPRLILAAHQARRITVAKAFMEYNTTATYSLLRSLYSFKCDPTLIQGSSEPAKANMAAPMEQSIHRDPALLYAIADVPPPGKLKLTAQLATGSYSPLQSSWYVGSQNTRIWKFKSILRSSPVSSVTTLPSSSPALPKARTPRPARTTLPPPRHQPPQQRPRYFPLRLRCSQELHDICIQRRHIPEGPAEQGQTRCEPHDGSGGNGGDDGDDEGEYGDDGAADVDHGLDQCFFCGVCN